ncbi:hypothetical protein D3C86_1801770 [compost metagenome]
MEGLLCEVFNHLKHRNSGIVHKNIQRPEVDSDGVKQTLHIGGLAHVCLNGYSCATLCLNLCHNRIGVSLAGRIVHYDSGARRTERPGYACADTF